MNKLGFIVLIMFFLTSTSSADISVSLDSDKNVYSPGDVVEFTGVVELTECEQMDDVNLNIDDGVHLSCSLPKHYGHYSDYGTCNLDVIVVESNYEDCYAYGGGNTVDYTILWDMPGDCVNEDYTAELIVSYDCETFTGTTEFEVVCTTTTTMPTTTMPTTSTTSTTSTTTSTTTTTIPVSTTTTTVPVSTTTTTISESTTTTTVPVSTTTTTISESTTTTTVPVSTTTTTVPVSTTTTTVPVSTTTTTVPESTTTTTIKKRTPSDGTNYACGEGSPRGIKIISACKDDLKNYGETDVDCGGPCPPCEDNESCLTNSDCVSEYCYDHVCRTPSCSDGIKNLNETDTDCGGSCPPCDNGRDCVLDSDCLSGVCYRSVCKAPSCSDGVLNQDEVDVDCGGLCDPCSVGKKCVLDSDCLSGYCYEGACRIPTCFDGVLNQDEVDVDCGGLCDPCSVGKKCVLDSDCLSGYCSEGACRTPTCSDGVLNQGEDDIDCGGPCKPCVPAGVFGYVIALSRSPVGILLLLMILLLLFVVLLLHKRRGSKYVASVDFLKDIKADELEDFITKRNPHIVAGTSRKLRRLKKFIDAGEMNIVWIQDWDLVNDLVSKGLDDNNAESIVLAKQLKAGLFITDPDARRIAEEINVEVLT